MTENTNNYKALEEGVYGKNGTPALRVIKQNNNLELDGGVTRFSWLVARTDDVKHEFGTAFLNLDLRQDWLSPEALCIAFRNGEPHEDAPEATTDRIANVTALLKAQAVDIANAGGAPEDKVEEEAEKIFTNTITRIRINVGQFNRLKFIAGHTGPIDLTDLTWLSGRGNEITGEPGTTTEFTGEVVPGYNKDTSEVKTIIGKA